MNKTQIIRYLRSRTNLSADFIRAVWPIMRAAGAEAGISERTVLNHFVILGSAWSNGGSVALGLRALYSSEQSGWLLEALDTLARYSDRHPEDRNV